MEKEKDSFI